MSPSSFTLDPHMNQRTEMAALRESKEYAFKDPQFLFGYSKDSEYKDLGIYFDFANRKSAVNHAVTQAFKIYGLGGNPSTIDWEEIRGPALIFRMEPSTFMVSGISSKELEDKAFQPRITATELIDTLLFFTDRCPRDIALRRDAQRFVKRGKLPAGVPSSQNSGPAGVRPWGKVAGKGWKDSATCDACGVAATKAGELRRCACLGAAYCGRECQRADWKRHRAAGCTAPRSGRHNAESE
jgi:hypothetical protein